MILRLDFGNRDRERKIIRTDKKAKKIPQKNRTLIKIGSKISHHENKNQLREISAINKKEKKIIAIMKIKFHVLLHYEHIYLIIEIRIRTENI
jgi:hypothetical protein